LAFPAFNGVPIVFTKFAFLTTPSQSTDVSAQLNANYLNKIIADPNAAVPQAPLTGLPEGGYSRIVAYISGNYNGQDVAAKGNLFTQYVGKTEAPLNDPNGWTNGFPMDVSKYGYLPNDGMSGTVAVSPLYALVAQLQPAGATVPEFKNLITDVYIALERGDGNNEVKASHIEL